MHLIAALGMFVAVVCIIGRAIQIGVENHRAHREMRAARNSAKSS